MKKSLVFLFVFASLLITACGNDAANDNDAVDTRSNDAPAGPAPDNDDATRQSLPDTTFTDSANKTIDTTRL